jgi:hypothetical protein
MSRILQVKTRLRPIDSPSAFYARMAEAVPADVMLVLGPGIWRELKQELHSVAKVGQWAVELAIRLDRVVLLNVPGRDGESCTVTLAPPGWSRERLAGYIAARHEELEETFGPIARVRGAA